MKKSFVLVVMAGLILFLKTGVNAYYPEDRERSNNRTPVSSQTVSSPTEMRETIIPDEEIWGSDANYLSQMVYGEGRGLTPDDWKRITRVVLNRVDDPRFPDTICAVVTQPYQFAGYCSTYPVDKDIYQAVMEELGNWLAEKDGGATLERALPPEYLYFNGDGNRMYYATDYGMYGITGTILEGD